MKCRACSGAAVLWADRGDVALYSCSTCGFVSGQPSHFEPPERHYEHLYRALAPPSPAVRYHEWLAAAEAQTGCGRLLEVGAGSGGFVRAALARGWMVDATEISKSALDLLSTTGAKVFAGGLAEAGYPNSAFDLVVSLEIVEHLEEPIAHLHELYRVTQRAGLLLLTTPNFNGLSRRLLGTRWRAIAGEHLGYFTVATLSRSLRQVGYRSVRVTTRYLDVVSWRRGEGPAGVGQYDPQTAAKLRDTIEGSALLRFGKNVVNRGLQVADLGDSLLAWAQR